MTDVAPRLPPGQALTRKFPVVGERAPTSEALDASRWRLLIDGAVENRVELDWSGWLGLPRAERVVDLHCVTGWTRLDTRLAGVPLATLLDRVQPRREARFVRFEAYSERAHDTSLPLDVARADVWLVDAIDGAPLAVENGGPLRTVCPSRYFYKSLKWLRRIELLVEDRRGFWERDSSYHDVGDPWPGDQRFSTGSIDPDELARFRAATDFGPWRAPRKVLLGVDLRGWRPAGRDLSGLRIKASDLSDADLSGCDLARANLSLSDLARANLVGVSLAGADVEGADFSGADLAGADLRDAALSATRFFRELADGTRLAARVAGLRLAGATGLLEAQEAFLREHGAIGLDAEGSPPATPREA